MGEPGWYNDDADPMLARWHDGERWTEHTLLKASWPGPGKPPPPVEPAPTLWIPTDRPDPAPVTSTLPPPPPLPPNRSLKDRYLGWPQWARIAGPVAVGLVVLAAVGSGTGDDGDDGRVETSTDVGDAEAVSVSEAASSALDDLDIDVSRGEMIVLVTALCDASSEDGATALSAITSEADDQAEVLDAAGGAAEDACPETVEDEPELLNDVLAAVVTTTTSTTVGVHTLPSLATSTIPPTIAAPRATTAPTRPPATQPPATQPPATQPPSAQCHPSYSGCLDPNSPDYDCAGGSGNGPDYTGRVEVYGPDPYGLDADGNGVGCEG
jgi:hypothetical protein